MQSVPITIKVVSSNPINGEVYWIKHYVIKFVSDLQQVGGFLLVLPFPPPIKLTTTILLKYCWKWLIFHNHIPNPIKSNSVMSISYSKISVLSLHSSTKLHRMEEIKDFNTDYNHKAHTLYYSVYYIPVLCLLLEFMWINISFCGFTNITSSLFKGVPYTTGR